LIIKCCGFDKCSGKYKKKPTSLKNTVIPKNYSITAKLDETETAAQVSTQREFLYLTINWCSSNQTQNAPWWQGKVLGLDESAVSKAVSLKDSTLKVSETNSVLPFFCKVEKKYVLIYDQTKRITSSAPA